MQLSGSNSEQAAAHNRTTILQAVLRGAPVSRTELARQSGLTKQAVARIVERLLDEGLLIEARRRHGLRGQPAIELEIDPEGVFAIGANIDRDHLTIVALDATGAVRGRIHHEVRYMMPDAFVARMEEAISSFRRRRVIDEMRLAGIGLAVPDWLGEVPYIGRPAAYSAWSRFDVRAAVERMTAHPVFIDNDANAAAIGELEYGLGKEIGSFAYLLANVGLGGGLVINGVRHRGAVGLGGEFSWLPVARDDGGAGPMETVGSEFSLFLLYDHLERHGIRVERPSDLHGLDDRGRGLVSAWLQRIAGKLADAVFGIGLVIDPEAVLIGGRLPARLIDELIVYVREELVRSGRVAPPLHRAATSEDAGALGAAAIALAHRFALPSAEPAQRTRVPLGFEPA